MIHTRVHKLAELVGDDLPVSTAHHYVIGDDLLKAMARDDVQRSIEAMIEAGIARLPFEDMLVEFTPTPGVTRFVWLKEAPGSLQALTAMLAGKLATLPTEPALVTIEGRGLRIERAADERDGQAVALATSFALLMLNVRGIEKVHIEPTRLNRARMGRARMIPAHIVLKIGVVYDREGRRTGAQGLKAVYLRAGHVRQQAIGPGWREHRPVYIAPQLVNYRDGAPPVDRLRVTKLGTPQDQRL